MRYLSNGSVFESKSWYWQTPVALFVQESWWKSKDRVSNKFSVDDLKCENVWNAFWSFSQNALSSQLLRTEKLDRSLERCEISPNKPRIFRVVESEGKHIIWCMVGWIEFRLFVNFVLRECSRLEELFISLKTNFFPRLIW